MQPQPHVAPHPCCLVGVVGYGPSFPQLLSERLPIIGRQRLDLGRQVIELAVPLLLRFEPPHHCHITSIPRLEALSRLNPWAFSPFKTRKRCYGMHLALILPQTSPTWPKSYCAANLGLFSPAQSAVVGLVRVVRDLFGPISGVEAGGSTLLGHDAPGSGALAEPIGPQGAAGEQGRPSFS